MEKGLGCSPVPSLSRSQVRWLLKVGRIGEVLNLPEFGGAGTLGDALVSGMVEGDEHQDKVRGYRGEAIDDVATDTGVTGVGHRMAQQLRAMRAMRSPSGGRRENGESLSICINASA